MTFEKSIKEHAVIIYFSLAILISWGLVLSIVGLEGIPGTTQEQDDLLYTIVFALLTGPIISSILMIAITHGKAGFRDFVSRLGTWKVPIHWYGIALLLAPVTGFITLYLLVPFSDVYIPAIVISQDKLGLLMTGIMIGLSAGIFEEIGWTGFAIPELRKKHSVLTTGLVVGIVWGAWHYITAFWGAGNEQGGFVLLSFLPMMTFYILVLPAYRILMAWVYENSQSLLIAILMHASLTGNVIYLLLSPELTEMALTIWYVVFAVPLWVIVGLLFKLDIKNLLVRQSKVSLSSN